MKKRAFLPGRPKDNHGDTAGTAHVGAGHARESVSDDALVAGMARSYKIRTSVLP
ncbi:hypothetical protein [Denitratisoma sp. DHT3]|uniref:hypothetical protein n=1 Tax=Denitratisoma sp. DHT3 TaxID=1981880 RepID=UPI001647E37F|nr:hypothetical protein [Denitratisoma sp. DHT3]